MLNECLAKAKRSAQERPFAQLISHTESYLERAKKRLTAHDAARQQFVTDVQESEARLERLRAFAAFADSVPRLRVSPESGNQVQKNGTHSLESSGETSTLNQLQEEQDALARELRRDIVERPRVRQRLSPAHGGDTIPPMHTLVPGDLSDWMQDRHADLQDAMSQGSRVDVLDVERSRKVGRDDRRHGTVTNLHRHSRYGLRGARVGEASNPGPRLFRRYPGARGAATLVDSDEGTSAASERIDFGVTF